MKTKNKFKDKQLKCFDNFISDTDIIFLGRILRDILLDYVVYNKDALPLTFDKSVYQLSLLFKLLDEIDESKFKKLTDDSS